VFLVNATAAFFMSEIWPMSRITNLIGSPVGGPFSFALRESLKDSPVSILTAAHFIPTAKEPV
jgi:hypothetical protein